MKYQECLYASTEYVSWYNSQIFNAKDKMKMKKFISKKHHISVRSLERYLKEAYVLDQFNRHYSKIDLRHSPGN